MKRYYTHYVTHNRQLKHSPFRVHSAWIWMFVKWWHHVVNKEFFKDQRTDKRQKKSAKMNGGGWYSCRKKQQKFFFNSSMKLTRSRLVRYVDGFWEAFCSKTSPFWETWFLKTFSYFMEFSKHAIIAGLCTEQCPYNCKGATLINATIA